MLHNNTNNKTKQEMVRDIFYAQLNAWGIEVKNGVSKRKNAKRSYNTYKGVKTPIRGNRTLSRAE